MGSETENILRTRRHQIFHDLSLNTSNWDNFWSSFDNEPKIWTCVYMCIYCLYLQIIKTSHFVKFEIFRIYFLSLWSWGHGIVSLHSIATLIDLGGDYFLNNTGTKGPDLAGRVKRNKIYSSLATVAKQTRKEIWWAENFKIWRQLPLIKNTVIVKQTCL